MFNIIKRKRQIYGKELGFRIFADAINIPMEHVYAVIMAGGVGTRFWPASTEAHPKQFLDILGTGETLLQQTFRRMESICSADRIYVVTHEQYADLTLAQLPGLSADRLLLEPARRNTAPCIAYAAFKLKKRDPLANFVVTPSDHLVANEAEFQRVLQEGLRTTKEHNILLTLGIQPQRPETGFGYIQFKEDRDSIHPEVKRVKSFTEKPDRAMAESFIAAGEFLWNAGIFLWNANAILSAFEKLQPEIYGLFNSGWEHFNTPSEKAFIEAVYPSCSNESVDYGILEKAKNVYVLPASFGWSDLGTWSAVHAQQTPDENGNTGGNEHVLIYNSRNNTLSLPEGMAAVIDGMEDMVVIVRDNRLLICRRSEEQEIKKFVSEVKFKLGNQFV
jgi:mannose-1-phosphate guanylyltransferase